jgi:hypothetical protein
MGRKLLWASLALAPVTFLLRWVFHADDTTLFIAAAAALVPLAWLIGEATEHAGEHTGPGIGGFLNASFGNAPELIIALFAVNASLPEVVRGSLAGSVVSNILLVLGAALIFGGGDARHGEPLDRFSLLLQLGLVTVAVLLFLVPSVPGWTGDAERHSLAVLSIPVSLALLFLYLGVTMWVAAPAQAPVRGERRGGGERRLVAAGLAGHARCGDRGHGPDQRDPGALARLVRALRGDLRVLHRRGDRRDRRERGRARRRDRDRAPRQAAARDRDRRLFERAGRATGYPRWSRCSRGWSRRRSR